MDFDKALAEIKDFLNVSEDTLLSQPVDLLGKMVNAVKDDNPFELHHLGYSMISVTWKSEKSS